MDLTVADLSFISLRVVLPALIACTDPAGDLVLMVKPQFEVGKDRLGAGGVVRDPELRIDAVRGVLAAAARIGPRRSPASSRRRCRGRAGMSSTSSTCVPVSTARRPRSRPQCAPP